MLLIHGVCDFTFFMIPLSANSHKFCLRPNVMAAGILRGRCCIGFTLSSVSKWYSPGRQPSPVNTSGYYASIWSLVRGSAETSTILTLSSRSMYLVTNPRFSLAFSERSGFRLASTVWNVSLCKEPLQLKTKSFLPLGVISLPPKGLSLALLLSSCGSPSCMTSLSSVKLITLHMAPVSMRQDISSELELPAWKLIPADHFSFLPLIYSRPLPYGTLIHLCHHRSAVFPQRSLASCFWLITFFVCKVVIFVTVSALFAPCRACIFVLFMALTTVFAACLLLLLRLCTFLIPFAFECLIPVHDMYLMSACSRCWALYLCCLVTSALRHMSIALWSVSLSSLRCRALTAGSLVPNTILSQIKSSLRLSNSQDSVKPLRRGTYWSMDFTHSCSLVVKKLVAFIDQIALGSKWA